MLIDDRCPLTIFGLYHGLLVADKQREKDGQVDASKQARLSNGLGRDRGPRLASSHQLGSVPIPKMDIPFKRM